MSDIIRLLPDVVANQIAAGEVVQRPASAVKELLENAIDAGATHIQLIVKEAGRTLIQVVDNGKGMTFADARMCFERHATSKIESVNDLFKLTTKGFRGEALASIAAIAQVEMKTKQSGDDVGTLLVIEGTDVKLHEPVATQDGTSIAVKNLFFNVPARRNFLKSDSIEFGHIEEEFYRVALIHTEVAFTLTHNNKCILQLLPSNFKMRVVNIFGNHLKDKLFPVDLSTDQVVMSGFIAKPENAKKKKSEQYMFVNNRYIRHNLLNFAVEKAYAELIPDGYKPAYFMRLTVDPATIDINISPTKVDIKLQDERLIFGFLNSAVRKSIGTLSLTPRIDFDNDKSLDFSNLKPTEQVTIPTISRNPNYNPFDQTKNSEGGRGGSSYSGTKTKPASTQEWHSFFENIKKETIDLPSGINEDQTIDFQEGKSTENKTPSINTKNFIVLNNKYLLFLMNEQLTMLNVPNAWERILYESYLTALDNKPIVVQQLLFPETIVLSAGNAEILQEIKGDLLNLGYDIEVITSTQFAVNGVPSGESNENVQNTLEIFIDAYKSSAFLHRGSKETNIALSMAKQKRSLQKMPSVELEVNELINNLFESKVVHTTPGGQRIFHIFGDDAFNQYFQ